jgi:hypothetical protein
LKDILHEGENTIHSSLDATVAVFTTFLLFILRSLLCQYMCTVHVRVAAGIINTRYIYNQNGCEQVLSRSLTRVQYETKEFRSVQE